MVCHVICSTAVETAAYTVNVLGNRVNLTRDAHDHRDTDVDNGDSVDNASDNDDDKLRFNGAVLTAADLMATDGVVHVIDQLILPTDGLYLTTSAGLTMVHLNRGL